MEIENKISQYINITFGDESTKIQNTTPLLSSGIIDSISALQLVDFLEKEFNFQFKAHEVDQDNLDSIAIIAAFVKSKIQ